MASYSTNNIHNKLGDLSIDSLNEQTDVVQQKLDIPYPTKSLLSSSLAGEKFAKQPPILKIHVDELTRNLTDEHPEPELLATSVGKDTDGRLLPSLSTISLLSLNNNSMATNYLDMLPSKMAPHEILPGKPAPPVMERMSSYNNIRSRNSLTHLNQQRLQPYQKITSPTTPVSAEFASLTSPQNIPGSRNQAIITPDSPNLDPTSIGGSPSRFWLNSQTPPHLLLNSLSKSRPHMFLFTPLHSGNPASGSMHAVSDAINIKSGSDSPVFNPVQTPLEDFPMTPLFLNGPNDNYFVLTNSARNQAQFQEFDGIEENDREEEDDCSMEDQ